MLSPERYCRDLHAAADVVVKPVILYVEPASVTGQVRGRAIDGRDPNSLTFGES